MADYEYYDVYDPEDPEVPQDINNGSINQVNQDMNKSKIDQDIIKGFDPPAPKVPSVIESAKQAVNETLLDKIPESTWFFCFPLWFGVYCITILGIIHPLFWLKVMKVYRSELFMFMYVLVGFWSLLSVALLYAIIAESSCIYVFWIYYTIVFGATMAALMFILFCGFCILGMRRKSVVALVGLIYYLVTMYFVLVVNNQRREVFGLQKRACVECIERSASRFHGIPFPMNANFTGREGRKRRRKRRRKTTTLVTTTVNTMTTAVTTNTSSIIASTNTINTISAAPVAALFYADESTTADNPTRTWIMDFRRQQIDVSTESTTTVSSVDSMDRRAAIARLSEILINSDECRRPRKPAHGRYKTSGPGPTALRLLLRCDNGYRENSVAAECKNNWWDRPVPQCRKRRDPAPLPDPGGGCIMPPFPEHGEYTVSDHAHARPGDRVIADNVILLVTCEEPYRAVDPYVICVEGRWRQAAPSCQKHCKLVMDPTVDYKCFKPFKDAFLACGAWQPDGALVAAACKPGHAHRGPFRYMRCRGEAWDHVVSCLPNANFS